MAARIIVKSGIAAGTTYWIDRRVVRVGSDVGVDVSLPAANLPPHALTVEFRDGQYRVYNRSESNMQVGGRQLLPAGVDVWSADEALELAPDIRLALEVDADPTPATRPVLADVEDYDEEPATPEIAETSASAGDSVRRPGGSGTLVQLIVIVLCVLGGALLIVRDQLKSNDSELKPDFEAIVQSSLEASDADRLMVQRLQYAEAAVVRNNDKEARRRYGLLRDDLVQDREQVDGQPLTQQVLGYVEYRLSQLE